MLKKEVPGSDFCVLDSKPEYRLSKFERLTITGGEELEKAIAWFVKQLTGFSYSKQISDFHIGDVAEAGKFYAKEEWKTNPALFFRAPTAPPKVSEHAVHGLSDGEIVDLEFLSAYKVQNPAFASEYEHYKENKNVHIRWWRHSAAAKATVIAIHGFTMGDQRLNSLAFLPGFFYQAGLDVALIELPYHGRRRPKGGKGEESYLFPSSNVSRTNEAMGQIISDLRELKLYFDSKQRSNVGVIGMSLGGYIGALWASLDEISFCVPTVPMVSMPELAWELLSRGESFKKLTDEGMTLDMLRDFYHVHSPLAMKPKLSKDKLMIIAGLGDEIVPPRQPKLLWDHWKRPRISWLGGGHLAHFRKSKAFRDILEFFKDLGYVTDVPTIE